MQAQQQMVREFLIKHLGTRADGRPNKTSLFNKWLLIREEYKELTVALGVRGDHDNEFHDARLLDEVATIDGICDLLYVIYNMCEELDIDIEPFFAEVHRSNMTKTPGRLSPTQKIMKGPEWEPPRLVEILRRQRAIQKLQAET